MKLSLLTALAACSESPSKSYVLVHGAWMGSEGWNPVAEELRASGASVATPGLPAHGNDGTPAGEATLDGYAARVQAAIDEAPKPVILVGHSLAGVVITQVAERQPADIARLVYIGAFLPANGESLGQLAMTDGDSQLGPHLIFNENGTVDVEQAAFPTLFCADCDASGTQLLTGGYQAEPAAPIGTPVATGEAFAGVPKTYFHTAQDRVVSPALQAKMIQKTPVDREVTLDSSHVPMLSQPEAVADALLAE